MTGGYKIIVEFISIFIEKLLNNKFLKKSKEIYIPGVAVHIKCLKIHTIHCVY